MRLLVCGGREYSDYERVYEVLSTLQLQQKDIGDPITVLIHGSARGADKIAHAWAIDNKVQPVQCPALWDVHGKRAGALRNEAMLTLAPNLVVAFPGGPGTQHMMRIAKRAGLRVIEVDP